MAFFFFWFFAPPTKGHTRKQRQRQRHTQAATEAFEATAGRYRCGERQQGPCSRAAWEFPPTMVVAALRESIPPKTLPKHHSG